MIYITGDIHNNIDFDKLEFFKQFIQPTKNDVLIIAGDFGIPWTHEKTLAKMVPNYKNNLMWVECINNDSMLIEFLNQFPCKILFVDGNHENFDIYDELPEVDMFGSYVGKMSENIFHLKRGYVYIIEDKKMFTFGGAESVDKKQRIENLNWWRRELPNDDEINRGLENLAKHDFDIDYVVTHTMPKEVLQQAIVCLNLRIDMHKLADPMCKILDMFLDKIRFKKWYCGHMHMDLLYHNFQLCYQNFYKIDD